MERTWAKNPQKVKNICLTFPSLNFENVINTNYLTHKNQQVGIFYYNCNFCHICWKLIRGTYELVGPSNQFSDHTFYVKSKLKLFSSRFLWAKYFVLITFSNFGLWNITQGFFTFWGFLAQIRSNYTLREDWNVCYLETFIGLWTHLASSGRSSWVVTYTLQAARQLR